MNKTKFEWVKKVTGTTNITNEKVIQSLWSGYGEIVRLTLDGDLKNTVILKNIDLSAASNHPRGWNTNISHERKIKSYEVETNWYQDWNTNEVSGFKTANCIGTSSVKQNQYILLEDLDASGYPGRKSDLNINEALICVKWLANYHAYYMGKKPVGLWQEGTYWHLNTRPDEWKAMDEGLLKKSANRIDEILRGCKYQTIIHGDAKVANFCFSVDAKSVAVVDFQYVGGGCGMKDLVYFMGSCLDEEECEKYEETILSKYFKELAKAMKQYHNQGNIAEIEKEWRHLYALAWTDFTRFLLGWMPTHKKLNSYSLKMKNVVLEQLNE